MFICALLVVLKSLLRQFLSSSISNPLAQRIFSYFYENVTFILNLVHILKICEYFKQIL